MKYISSLFLLFLFFQSISTQAKDQSYPDKSVRIVVPWAAGGATDASARIIADRLSNKFKESFFVENKPGVGGILGMKYFVDSAPDGYTLAINANNLVGASEIYKTSLYDWKSDMVPIAGISFTPIVILVKPDSNIKNMKDLIDLAKQSPEKISVADVGVGSNNNIVVELISGYTQVKFLQVHYNSPQQGANDLMGGFVDVQVDNLGSSMELIKAGKVRALAITSPNRWEDLPEIPTVKETKVAGLENFSFIAENFMFGPKGLAQEKINILNKAINDLLNDFEVKNKFKNIGLAVDQLSPSDIDKRLMETENQIVPVLKKLNINLKK